MNRQQVQQEADASLHRDESESRWIDSFMSEAAEIDQSMQDVIRRSQDSTEREAEFYKQLNAEPF